MGGIAGLVSKKEVDERSLHATLAKLGHSIGLQSTPPVAHIGRYSRFAFASCQVSEPGAKNVNVSLPLYNARGDVGTVFHGLLYNRDQFDQLLNDGGFKPLSDAEIVLRLYETIGLTAFGKLDGEFVFCLWDDRNSSIYLVRDPFGIRTLCIYEDDTKIIFAPKVAAIASLADVATAYNPSGLLDLMAFGHINAPHTVYRNMRRLPAGGFVQVRDGRTTLWTHTDFSEAALDPAPDAAGAAPTLRQMVVASVARHVEGHHRPAVLVDGGASSIALAGSLRQLGVDFAAFGFLRADADEQPALTVIEQSFGVPVHNLHISAADLTDRTDEILVAMDQPLVDPLTWPFYLIWEQIKPFSLLLFGDGGDVRFDRQHPVADQEGGAFDLSTLLNRETGFVAEGPSAMRSEGPSSRWRRFQKYLRGPSAGAAISNCLLQAVVSERSLPRAAALGAGHAAMAGFPFLRREIWAFSSSFVDKPTIPADVAPRNQLEQAFGEYAPVRHLPATQIANELRREMLIASREKAYDLASGLRHTALAEVLDFRRITNIFDEAYAGRAQFVPSAWALYVLFSWISLRQVSLRKQRDPSSTEKFLERGTDHGAEMGLDRSRHRQLLADSGFFDPDWYRNFYSDLRDADIDPLDHYLDSGGTEGRAPSPFFDGADYMARYPDVAEAGLNPLLHFITRGAGQGRRVHGLKEAHERKLVMESGLFDPEWYAATYPDVAATGLDLLDHYLTCGGGKGYAPGPLFDGRDYLVRYPDVAASGVNPLFHYQGWGKDEGRSIRRVLRGDQSTTELDFTVL